MTSTLIPRKFSHLFAAVALAFSLTLPFAFRAYGQDSSKIMDQALKIFLFGEREEYKEALALARKAFALGNADGALLIAVFYEIGCGVVSQDFAKSDKWYHQAAKMGSEKAKQQIELYQKDNGEATRKSMVAMSQELTGC